MNDSASIISLLVPPAGGALNVLQQTPVGVALGDGKDVVSESPGFAPLLELLHKQSDACGTPTPETDLNSLISTPLSERISEVLTSDEQQAISLPGILTLIPPAKASVPTEIVSLLPSGSQNGAEGQVNIIEAGQGDISLLESVIADSGASPVKRSNPESGIPVPQVVNSSEQSRSIPPHTVGDSADTSEMLTFSFTSDKISSAADKGNIRFTIAVPVNQIRESGDPNLHARQPAALTSTGETTALSFSGTPENNVFTVPLNSYELPQPTNRAPAIEIEGLIINSQSGSVHSNTSALEVTRSVPVTLSIPVDYALRVLKVSEPQAANTIIPEGDIERPIIIDNAAVLSEHSEAPVEQLRVTVRFDEKALERLLPDDLLKSVNPNTALRQPIGLKMMSTGELFGMKKEASAVFSGLEGIESSRAGGEPPQVVMNTPQQVNYQPQAATMEDFEKFEVRFNRIQINQLTGKGEIRLRLRPEQLGVMRVKLVTVENEVSARFEVGSERARQVVEFNLPLLKENLERQGIRVDSVEVTVNDDLNQEQRQAHYRNAFAAVKPTPKQSTMMPLMGEIETKPAATVEESGRLNILV